MTPSATIDERFLRVSDGQYRLDAGDEHGTVLELRHVRRERYQLHGELTVQTAHVHARSSHGVLMVVDVNLSTSRGLDDAAGAIARRLGAHDTNTWQRILHELGTGVAMAERTGEPSVRLTGERIERADQGVYQVLGFRLPQVHPAILFGYGDTLKSYALDAIAVDLDRRGISGLFVDAEMDTADHQDRVAALLGGERTNFLRYVRCNRPLIFEVDRLREIIREHAIQYAFFDSVGFLAHEKPESSDAALRYFAAVRTLGRIGSLHIAHRAGADHGDRFPFGSQFWHNSARATWYAERPDKTTEAGGQVDIAYHCRKFNVGSFPVPHGLRFSFTDTTTTVTSINPATVPELAKGLSVQRRIAAVLKTMSRGTVDDIRAELDDVNAETVGRILRRYADPENKHQMFVKLADGRYSNVEKRYAA